MPRPNSTEYAPFYQTYINRVDGDNIQELLSRYSRASLAFWQSIAEEKGDYAYAPGKWSIKQLVNHLSDSERIFAYRALRIARGDETPLAGFEENDYADAARVQHRTLKDLVHEFQSVRSATLSLFNSFSETELTRLGTANGASVSVNAIGFVIVGHTLHHELVARERYGV